MTEMRPCVKVSGEETGSTQHALATIAYQIAASVAEDILRIGRLNPIDCHQAASGWKSI